MCRVDELVAVLDERGEWWDIYRHASGWCVSMGRLLDGDLRRSVHGATIGEVLAAAMASPPIPLVPPRPRRRYADQFELYRQTASKWAVQDKTNGQDVMFSVRSRKLCVEAIDRHVVILNELADAWEAKWLPVIEAGAVGVDYRIAE